MQRQRRERERHYYDVSTAFPRIQQQRQSSFLLFLKRELPYMMSALERGKADVVRGLREFYNINQIQMRTGEGVKKSKKIADITSGSSQSLFARSS